MYPYGGTVMTSEQTSGLFKHLNRHVSNPRTRKAEQEDHEFQATWASK